MVIKKGEQMLASDVLNLTFFPKGTVLMYSSAAWSGASAEFKEIWHICDGSTVDGYTTLDLVDKFIRGSTASGATGGTDTTEVPYHTHGVTEAEHNHTQNAHNHSYSEPNLCDGGGYPGGGGHPTTKYTDQTTATNRPAKTNLSVDYAGSNTADNRPSFCTVIFIEKIV